MLNIESIGRLPIGSAKWPKFDEYKQLIIDHCLDREKQNTIESNVAPMIKSNIWESEFNFLASTPKLQELSSWCSLTVSEFSSQINQEKQLARITASWAHVSRPNGYHGPHRHPFSTWSGIFYVHADDTESAYTKFHNLFDLPRIPGYKFWEETFLIPFEPGSLVIFPSILLHYAPPYLGKDCRIVIAFDSVIL